MGREIATEPTEKRYLFALQLSVLIASSLIALWVVVDVRLNIIGEPFNEYIGTISIAISRIVYGVEGFVGLEQVLAVLKEIPVSSSHDFFNNPSYENYQLKVNSAIEQAIHLTGIDKSKIHAYTNDIYFLYYVTMALSLFGMQIQSLSYLWLLGFLISVLSFFVAYRSQIPSLFLLWCLLSGIFFVVVANPGVGVQLITMYNHRFLPILGLVPLLHIVIAMNHHQKSPLCWLLLLIQISLLVFVLLMRGSAQWMLIGMCLSGIYTVYANSRPNGAFLIRLLEYRGLAARMVPFALVITFFFLAKYFQSQPLDEAYAGDAWTSKHPVWYAAVIGVTPDPVLFEKYVCSDIVLEDRLLGFEQIPCNNTVLPLRNRVIHGVMGLPTDMHGYQASIKYLRDRGSDEQLGGPIRPGYFNIRWDRYDELMKLVYFDMLRENPDDLLYMYALVKPMRYLKEVLMYASYIGKSIIGAKNRVVLLAIIGVFFVLHLYLVRGGRAIYAHVVRVSRNEIKVLSVQLVLTFASSLILSIALYCQPQTIVDSVAVLFMAGLFLFTNRKLLLTKPGASEGKDERV